MALTAETITIDCAQPRALAEFWTRALDYRVARDVGDGAYVVLTGAHGPHIGLQQVPEARTGKNSVHLDLMADDLPGEVDRLVGLGATIVAEHSVPGWAWTVLADPEGNVFCVGAGK